MHMLELNDTAMGIMKPVVGRACVHCPVGWRTHQHFCGG